MSAGASPHIPLKSLQLSASLPSQLKGVTSPRRGWNWMGGNNWKEGVNRKEKGGKGGREK